MRRRLLLLLSRHLGDVQSLRAHVVVVLLDHSQRRSVQRRDPVKFFVHHQEAEQHEPLSYETEQQAEVPEHLVQSADHSVPNQLHRQVLHGLLNGTLLFHVVVRVLADPHSNTNNATAQPATAPLLVREVLLAFGAVSHLLPVCVHRFRHVSKPHVFHRDVVEAVEYREQHAQEHRILLQFGSLTRR